MIIKSIWSNKQTLLVCSHQQKEFRILRFAIGIHDEKLKAEDETIWVTKKTLLGSIIYWLFDRILTHTIHVWCTYLQSVDFHGKCRSR